MNLHFVQLEPDRSYRSNELEKVIRLSPHSTFQCYFNVQDKRTLELCLARWWSSLTIIETSYSIEFHSILLSLSRSIHLRSSQSYERFILENRLNHTYEEIIGLPIINWKYLVQTLRPNKEESKIQILSKRDCLAEQRQIYQLILVFNFTLVRKKFFVFFIRRIILGFQLKASEIQVKCPYLHDLLYDNEYEAALWMCFDANKQYLGSGDVIKDVRKTIFRFFYLSDSLFLVFIKIRKRRFCYSNANST
jgi:tripeptidyl-peptidase-2